MLSSERMARALSEELGNEYWAAIQYTMVSAYFSREALPQLATLFRQQASEELMHAQKIADYVTETGGVVEVPSSRRARPTSRPSRRLWRHAVSTLPRSRPERGSGS